MSQPVISEIPDSLLFRFRLRCRKFNSGGKKPAELASSHALPTFGEGELPSGKPFAQLRAGWNEQGMYFWLKVKGRKHSLWCRSTQLLESDGLQIWLDTRDTHNVHRATKFCHWFLLLPAGGGPASKKPIATMLKINRAKEHSPAINQMPIPVDSKVQKSGYELAAFLPAECLNGWDSADHRLIGFNYVVNDRELGSQSLAVGLDYPVAEDPALWNTLVLAE